MCSSTHFPEAIPLRSIKTNTILKALIKFFTLFGLPKSIQSDQGTNFMAHAFQQVMNQLAFDKVKLLLQKSPVLKSPDYEKPFKLIIDSSDVGTGSVLVQEASDGLDHPVSYFSKKFLKYQKNYSVVEKETLGLVLALEHFDVYLGSTPFKIKVYTDHNLTFLKTMKNKNQRLVRWSLALQEYNLEIQHIPESENVVADALSRCIG